MTVTQIRFVSPVCSRTDTPPGVVSGLGLGLIWPLRLAGPAVL